MTRYYLFLLITFIISSCDSDPYSVTMQDGRTIQYVSTPQYYSTEDDFVHDVTLNFPHQYDYSHVENIDYAKDSLYTVYGHDQTFIGYWQKAKFGDWIKVYGLEPNEYYYVATKWYTKFVSMPQGDLSIYPKSVEPFKRYHSESKTNSFITELNKGKHAYALSTAVKYIGYDSKGKSIYLEIPSFDDDTNRQLTWKFSVDESFWE